MLVCLDELETPTAAAVPASTALGIQPTLLNIRDLACTDL